jgi:hypothetical protein
MQGINYTCLRENPQIPHIMSALSEPHEGEGKLSFDFKNLYKISSDGAEGRKGLYFKLFHSPTTQSFMVDTWNPAV